MSALIAMKKVIVPDVMDESHAPENPATNDRMAKGVKTSGKSNE